MPKIDHTNWTILEDIGAAVDALESILRCGAVDMSYENLCAVVALHDFSLTEEDYNYSTCVTSTIDHPISFSQAKLLAEAELARRGLNAQRV